MLDALLACEFLDLGSMSIDDEMIPILAIGGGFVVAIFAITAGTIRSVSVGRAREASRREIAAYIAEGSMSAEEGQRLLDAGRPHWERWHS
jgi:hypothetical protein